MSRIKYMYCVEVYYTSGLRCFYYKTLKGAKKRKRRHKRADIFLLGSNPTVGDYMSNEERRGSE